MDTGDKIVSLNGQTVVDYDEIVQVMKQAS
ncbi:hypothetical protein [Streptococcus sciuri]